MSNKEDGAFTDCQLGIFYCRIAWMLLLREKKQWALIDVAWKESFLFCVSFTVYCRINLGCSTETVKPTNRAHRTLVNFSGAFDLIFLLLTCLQKDKAILIFGHLCHSFWVFMLHKSRINRITKKQFVLSPTLDMILQFMCITNSRQQRTLQKATWNGIWRIERLQWMLLNFTVGNNRKKKK